MQADPDGKFRRWFIFGGALELQTTDNITCVEYDTEELLQAFLDGVDAMNGYMDYQSFDDEAEAVQHAESVAYRLRMEES